MATEPIQSEDEDRGRRDTHPAFGTATVTRASGTPRVLFQSDLRHNETISLTISTAERGRHLNHDWVHPRRTLVEVEMSLAQWGALVSSIGIGSGVPVTLRRTESAVRVPDLPYEPRIAESVSETKGTVAKLLMEAQETLAELEAAVEGKQGARAVRDALRNHRATLMNAESNAGFAVTSLARAAETLTSQARADIEAQIITAQMITGSRASIDAPEMSALEARSEPTD